MKENKNNKKKENNKNDEKEEQDLEIEDQDREDLYKTLQISKNATKDEIKKAYYKLALKVHPDRNPNDNEAKEKFQKLGRAYEILSDNNKRYLYDQTGIINDENYLFNEESDISWEEYWKLLFKKVSKEDIEEFEGKYRYSQEEQNDLKLYYEKYKGDMEMIIQCIPLSTDDDLERFYLDLNKYIKLGELPSYPKFKKSQEKLKKEKHKRKINQEKEMKEIEKVKKKENDIDSYNKLAVKIQQNKLDSVIEKLEKQYNKKPNKKKNSFQEPSEEEFQKIQESIKKRKQLSTKQKGDDMEKLSFKKRKKKTPT